MRSSLFWWAAAWVGFVALGSTSCSVRDCAEERAGQVRCVANRAERCLDDGSLEYTSCATNGLFCSEQHQGCVTKDVLDAAGGSDAGGGDNSGGDGGGGTGGMGGTGGNG